MTNIKTESNLWRNQFREAYQWQPSTEGNQGWSLAAGTEAKVMKEWSLACSLGSHLAVYLTPFGITCLGEALPVKGWVLLHPSATKKIPCRLDYRSVWWRHFLNWSFFLLDTLACIRLTKEVKTQRNRKDSNFPNNNNKNSTKNNEVTNQNGDLVTSHCLR